MICFDTPQFHKAHSMWFIAQYSANYKAQLAQHCAQYKLLYEHTELAKAREISPLILKVDSSDLLNAIAEDLQNGDLQGCIFSTSDELNESQLLAHFRSRMFVKVAKQARALLHYYNPRVLEALLCGGDDNDSQSWISGLLSISWYSKHQESQSMWCTLHNLSEATHQKLPPTPWLLTSSQLAALSTLED